VDKRSNFSTENIARRTLFKQGTVFSVDRFTEYVSSQETEAVSREPVNHCPDSIGTRQSPCLFCADEQFERQMRLKDSFYLHTISFMDANFRKQLESALRFGTTLFVHDAENFDPLINPVLIRDLRRTSGRVLITIGDKDIDFSPTFRMFLFTRDSDVRAARTTGDIHFSLLT
jgi:hypothetical protein